MRLIVMFDLPTETSADKRNYREFRKYLISNGYVMMQYSVYSKLILNYSVLNYQKKKLYENAPRKGNIDILVITEKQYANIENLIVMRTRSDQVNSTNLMIFL